MAEGRQPEGCTGLLNLSWDEIHGIMERAVQRGLGLRGSLRFALPGEAGEEMASGPRNGADRAAN